MAAPNVALVISGGGAKGAFAVGVIKKLFEKYRSTGWFSIVGGTSTGALIAPMAALMAHPVTLKDDALRTLVELYTTVTTKDILRKRHPLEYLIRLDCLNESKPLRKLLNDVFKPEWFSWLQSAAAPDCYVAYVNYRTGQVVTVHPRDNGMTRERFLDAMLASASVPVIMNSTRISDEVCYDGGVRDLLPFSAAIDAEATRILPIFLEPLDYPVSDDPFKRLDKILLRTLNILVDEAGRNDAKFASHINTALKAKQDLENAFTGDQVALGKIRAVFANPNYGGLYGDKKVIDIIDTLRPNAVLTDNSLTFDPVLMRDWLKQGERIAEQQVTTSPFV